MYESASTNVSRRRYTADLCSLSLREYANNVKFENLSAATQYTFKVDLPALKRKYLNTLYSL